MRFERVTKSIFDPKSSIHDRPVNAINAQATTKNPQQSATTTAPAKALATEKVLANASVLLIIKAKLVMNVKPGFIKMKIMNVKLVIKVVKIVAAVRLMLIVRGRMRKRYVGRGLSLK